MALSNPDPAETAYRVVGESTRSARVGTMQADNTGATFIGPLDELQAAGIIRPKPTLKLVKLGQAGFRFRMHVIWSSAVSSPNNLAAGAC